MATRALPQQQYYSPPRHHELPASEAQPPLDDDAYLRPVYRGTYEVKRTSSHRRRNGAENTADIPAAPDAPRISRDRRPAAYRDSYDPYEMRGTGPSSKSFAARATAIQDQIDAGLPPQQAYPPVLAEPTRSHARRSSEGHSSRAQYPTPQQTSRQSYALPPEAPPQRKSSASDRRYSAKGPERASVAVPGPHAAEVRPTQRSATDWAADRSPLQKLEVKLNDISKEEKRARVQEAEQRLREKRASQGLDVRPARADSRRVVSDSRGIPPQTSRHPDGISPPTQDSFARRTFSGPPTETIRKSQIPVPVHSNDASPLNSKNAKRTSMSTRSTESGRPRRSLETGRPEDRAVRFLGDAQELEATPTKPQPVSRQPERQQNEVGAKREARPRPGSIQAEDNFHAVKRSNNAEVAIPSAHDHHHDHHLKHQLPPQTDAGRKARQQIGFGMDVDVPTESAEEHRHRMPHLFHRHQPEQTTLDPKTAARQLNEWKDGETARLTLLDALAEPLASPKLNRNKAWWEESPNGRRRSAHEAEVTLFDGAQENSNGMNSLPFSHRKPSLVTAANVAGPVRARQYIGYAGTLKPKQRNRMWLRSPRSVLRLHFAANVPRALTFSYSYACTILSEHDPFHEHHICLPYESKELMKTMRAIRVRVPAEPTMFTPPMLLKCGPLLRYTGIKRENQPDGQSSREVWRGSVMIVTTDLQSVYEPAPTLRLYHQPMDLLPPPPTHFDDSKNEDLPSEYVDPVGGLPKITRTGGTVWVKPAEDLEIGRDVSTVENDDGLFEAARTANVPSEYGRVGEMLGKPSGNPGQGKPGAPKPGRFREVKGVRLHAERGVTFWRFNIEVELGDEQMRVAYRINKGASIGFWVPGRGETMNVMFHSCNGFSMSVDPNNFSGPDPLWRDVLNAHQTQPFHVMIGGGDQIYNDAVMKQTRLFQEWLDIRNPHHKHEAEFTPEMQEELETFYLERYSMWFSQGLFGMANSQIPMINIWDDHDIIDGFGSYPDSFMSTPVFCGLGNIAYKYYMLFQHQSVDGETEEDEPSWVLGSGPGPYISTLSRSVFVSLGKRVAFLGVDCRTERTRDEVLSENTYDLLLDRCRRELARGETRHLLVLLGVPIAYPRLVWLENVLTSRALDPLKALGRMGLFGNLMNKFDGGVEILDDLDDHWTAKNHKQERNWFVEELQLLAAEKSVRITILSGDVHLAAVGQFYSHKTLKVPKDKDHRYMPNIISSAIVNTPPPDMMADVLNRRNKIHHLNRDTDEEMIPMFTHDVDGKPRNNKCLLPKRNWCSITEYLPGSTPPPTPPSLTPTESEVSLPPQKPPSALQRTLSLGGKDSKPAQLIRRLSLGSKPTYQEPSRSPSPDIPEQDDDGFDNFNHGSGQSRSAPIPLPTRPANFQRQPTTLENAAKKGGGEYDGHINLEYGLDVKLNCEIKQGDPSGVTESYRLLVPALYYGNAFAPLQERKPSLVRRLTNSMRIGSRDHEEDDWSFSGSEDEAEQELHNDARPAAAVAPAASTQSPKAGFFRIPTRGASLLRKRNQTESMPPPARNIEPFKPRPRISMPMTSTEDPRIPNSAPATQTQHPREIRDPRYDAGPASASYPAAPPRPSQERTLAAQHQKRGADPSDAAYDDADDLSADEDEDELDEDDELATTPRRRVASKFDRSGASKYFGAPPVQGDGNASGAKRRSGDGRQGFEDDDGYGYDGIEAYREKKGWRRLLGRS